MVFKSAINSPADYKFKQQSCASRVSLLELRLARIAPREYAALFASLKKANLQRHSLFQQSCASRIAPQEWAALFASLKKTIERLRCKITVFPRFPRFNFTLKMSGEILVLDVKFIFPSLW